MMELTFNNTAPNSVPGQAGSDLILNRLPPAWQDTITSLAPTTPGLWSALSHPHA